MWPIDEADASQNPGKRQRTNEQSNWVAGQVKDDTPALNKKKGVPKTRQPTKYGKYLLAVIVLKTISVSVALYRQGKGSGAQRCSTWWRRSLASLPEDSRGNPSVIHS